ncbi:hypothetical protein [Wolbachia endosymbiont (group B) of Ischnura elegans]|uniref:hypothetical protein n=1 Tax=Wolbachia endosymbiont (group B) of Ischnura elegans TaxID=2954021 RepID=UPI002231B5C3|nr:hypothetical protein [Wolbachia endosymbiont (group B) of Ischnura elegans]
MKALKLTPLRERLRSERGERFVERMLSIFLTSRLNGQNPFQKLQNLVAVTA